MADDRLFRIKIITPDRVFYEGEVIMVEFNTTEGEIGVFKGHMPLTVIVAPGVLTLSESESSMKVAALHSGFVEILQEQVTILAEVVEWPEEIDQNRAEEARIRAQRRLEEAKADTDMARASTALQRSLARLEAAKK